MTRPFNPGIKVTWHLEEGTAQGTIDESFITTVTREINGEEVARKATARNPAYLIKQENGDTVMKSHSEIEPV